MVACSMLLPGGDVRQAQHAALPSTFSNAELIQPGQGAGRDQEPRAAAACVQQKGPAPKIRRDGEGSMVQSSESLMHGTF